MYLLITFEPGTVHYVLQLRKHTTGVYLLVQRSKLVLVPHAGCYSYVPWCQIIGTVPMVLVLLAAVNHTACTRI